MKTRITGFFLFTLMALFVLAPVGCNPSAKPVAAAEKAQRKPNIVFFFADDLGNNAISINGNRQIATPNIDKIGQDGARFLQSYVTAPICCASRAGLLTGRYQQRFGSENHLTYPNNSSYIGDRGQSYADFLLSVGINPDSLPTQGIPKTEINIAQLLKQQGYATALIGKWHAGFYDGYRPHQRGFDFSWGWYGGSTLYYVDEKNPDYVTFKDNEGKYSHYTSLNGKYQWQRDEIATGLFRNGEPVDEKEYQTYAIGREAIQFVEKNKDQPFFLYVPFGAIHTPLQAPKKYYDQLGHVKDRQQRFVLAMLMAQDEVIGQIQKKIADLGLAENTIFVYAGDNGCVWQNETGYDPKAGTGTYFADDSTINLNYPLKGGKTTHYEGGIRTPLLISWPGKIDKGQVFEAPVTTLDLFPTFAQAAGIALPGDRKYDGVDLIPFLAGEKNSRPHPALFWRNGGVKTIRKGDYKLLVNDFDKTVYLYNLANDPYEKNDLSKAEPAKVAELKKDFVQWETELVPPRWNSPRVSKVYVDGKQVSFQP